MADSKKWFRLDNAALIYMPTRTRKWNHLFRVACVLKDKVDKDVLQSAVNDLMPRFPTMMVSIKSGFFWYYYETLEKPPMVTEETDYPCRPFDIRSKRYLIRILYYNNRISVEAFHAVTDGGGAMIYLVTLLRRYFELLGLPVVGYEGCLDYKDLPAEEEKEDAFQRYADGKTIRPRKERRAYQIKLDKVPGGFYLIHGVLQVPEVKRKAKEYGATIGQLVTAVLFKTLNDYIAALPLTQRKKIKDPVKISIPFDLRKRFNSRTLRNFSSYMNMECNETEFSAIVNTVKANNEQITSDFIQGNINANLSDEHKLGIRLMPLFLKNIGLKAAHKMFGESLLTMVFSNLNVVSCPPIFHNYVERFEAHQGPLKRTCMSASGISFGDKLVISLASASKNTTIERLFFQNLTDIGLCAVLDTNRRECNE